MQNNFGSELKDLRLRAGFKTKKKLSEVSGVSQTTLSRVEAGEQNPSPDILKKLADPLAVSYEDLMHKAGYLDQKAPPRVETEWLQALFSKTNTKALLQRQFDVFSNFLLNQTDLPTEFQDKLRALEVVALPHFSNFSEIHGVEFELKATTLALLITEDTPRDAAFVLFVDLMDITSQYVEQRIMDGTFQIDILRIVNCPVFTFGRESNDEDRQFFRDMLNLVFGRSRTAQDRQRILGVLKLMFPDSQDGKLIEGD